MSVYKISKIDGNRYCVSNGSFLRHLSQHQLTVPDYHQLYEPDQVRHCEVCGDVARFVVRQYRKTCNDSCQRELLSRRRLSRTEAELQEFRNKVKTAHNSKSIEERQALQLRRKQTAIENGSYKKASEKRRNTCIDKYGDGTYNNPTKISETKLNWTVERKLQFLRKLKEGLGGKWMSDFATDSTWINRRKKLEELGKVVPLERLSEWEQYQKRVRALTERTYRRHKDTINPYNHPRTLAGIDGGYQLDHIVPIKFGFLQQIPAEDIAGVRNLQMLPWRDNAFKSATMVEDGWQVLTDEGYKPFKGISTTTHQKYVRIVTTTQHEIDCSLEHQFALENGFIQAKDIKSGTKLKGVNGSVVEIQSATIIHEDIVLHDVLEVAGDHTYVIESGVITHNCQFISSENTLIDQLSLVRLAGIAAKSTPKMKVKLNREFDIYFWSEITKGKTYLVSIDPSTGSGLDYTVVQCFEFPSLEQVCEFRSNTISTPKLYTLLKSLLTYIWARGMNNIFFTFENNGVGEGLSALYQNDEQPPPGELVSDEGNRIGFTTTGKSKIMACLKLKDMLETDKVRLHSPVVVRELKSYIRKAGSYAAQVGATDDAVSACLLMVRMLEILSSFDDNAFKHLYDIDTGNAEEWDLDIQSRRQANRPPDEDDFPMPMI